MPSCRNMPSMPKVRASSGTMGTTNWPIALSRVRLVSRRTKAMVVDMLPLAAAFRAAP
jgi:hypothetical protein